MRGGGAGTDQGRLVIAVAGVAPPGQTPLIAREARSRFDELGMRTADLPHRLILGHEGTALVRAIKHQALPLAVLMPQFLEAQRRGAITLVPEDAHHFAESTHSAMATPQLGDQ